MSHVFLLSCQVGYVYPTWQQGGRMRGVRPVSYYNGQNDVTVEWVPVNGPPSDCTSHAHCNCTSKLTLLDSDMLI